MSTSTASSFADYGGSKNDQAGPPEDASTDRAATQIDKLLSDTSMHSRMRSQAFVEFQYDFDNSVMVVASHDALWGNDASVKPEVTRFDIGQYDITWPETVNTPVENGVSVNLRSCFQMIESYAYDPDNLQAATFTKLAPNSIRVMVNATNLGTVSQGEIDGPASGQGDRLHVWAF